MKRREFLTQSVIAGAAGVLAPAVAFAGAKAAAATMAKTPVTTNVATCRLSKAWFESMLNEPFRLESQTGAPVAARLVAVHSRAGSARHEQFSAVFRVADGESHGGGLFQVEHAKAGRFPLLLS